MSTPQHRRDEGKWSVVSVKGILTFLYNISVCVSNFPMPNHKPCKGDRERAPLFRGKRGELDLEEKAGPTFLHEENLDALLNQNVLVTQN